MQRGAGAFCYSLGNGATRSKCFSHNQSKQLMGVMEMDSDANQLAKKSQKHFHPTIGYHKKKKSEIENNSRTTT